MGNFCQIAPRCNKGADACVDLCVSKIVVSVLNFLSGTTRDRRDELLA